MTDEIEWERTLGHSLPRNAPQHICDLYQHVADRVGTWKDAPTHEHRMLWNQARDAVISAMLEYVLDAEQRLGAGLSAKWDGCDRNEAIRQCEDRYETWQRDREVIDSLRAQVTDARSPAIRRDASTVLERAADEFTSLAAQLKAAGF